MYPSSVGARLQLILLDILSFLLYLMLVGRNLVARIPRRDHAAGIEPGNRSSPPDPTLGHDRASLP